MQLFDELVDLPPQARETYFASHSIDAETRKAVESLLAFSEPDHKLVEIIQAAVGSLYEETEPPPGTLCGPFRLVKKIARGGMGCLYLAERVDGEVRHVAAVKLLRGGPMAESARQRFLLERQILANLSHPNITKLYDAGHLPNDQPYLVMEYVDGVAFDVHCASLPLRQRILLFAAVCEAVAYAHRMLVIHRDLKPNNILVTKDDVPKLLDFGIAKLLDTADATTTVDHRFTPAYASPEQLRAEPTSTATDIYSLGAILMRIVTGEAPGVATVEDRDLDAIVKKAMRPDPEHRYSSAAEMGEDLQAWLESLPVKARFEERWYRPRRLLRRYWIPAAAAVLAFCGLTVGLLIARHERDLAEQRYHEIRRLAGQLFALEQDISNLPGGTKAREQIVRSATEYLERLSADTGNDLLLRVEIADGYRKVAEIQGGFRSVNLGMSAQAQASLTRAAALVRPVLEQKPNDARAVRVALDIAELQSRIHYGNRDSEKLAASMPELESLALRYQPLAGSTSEEWDFLGGIHQSIAAGYRETGHPREALAASLRCVEMQRRAFAIKDVPSTRGNLSVSLSALGKARQAGGDLEGAVESLREGLEIMKGMRAKRANDFRLMLNLSATHADIAALLSDDYGGPLGRVADAIREYDTALEIGRKAVAMDPGEKMVRLNTAVSCWKRANLVRLTNPAAALPGYSESMALLRTVPKDFGSREQARTVLLAEWSVALIQSGNVLEAARLLAEARQLAAEGRPGKGALGTPAEAVSRAEAALAVAHGQPAEAVRIHRRWLESTLPVESASLRRDYRIAMVFAHRYKLLADALRHAGQPQEATQAEAEWQRLRHFQPEAANSQ